MVWSVIGKALNESRRSTELTLFEGFPQLFQIYFIPIVAVLQIVEVFVATVELKSIMGNLGDITNLYFWSIKRKDFQTRTRIMIKLMT